MVKLFKNRLIFFILIICLVLFIFIKIYNKDNANYNFSYLKVYLKDSLISKPIFIKLDFSNNSLWGYYEFNTTTFDEPEYRDLDQANGIEEVVLSENQIDEFKKLIGQIEKLENGILMLESPQGMIWIDEKKTVISYSPENEQFYELVNMLLECLPYTKEGFNKMQ